MFRIVPLLLLFFAADSLSAQDQSPNFIIIFTDDQGYQDLGCFGSPDIQTPRIDQIASEGVKFTSFYSASSVCSPSRAALLTGCYPPRVGITRVLFPRHDTGLADGEITIAELLKTRGYATACIGKWHLGHHAAFLPTQQGFDTYFGIPYSNDMSIDQNALLADDIVLREGLTRADIREREPQKNWVPLLENDQVVEYPADQTSLTARYTDRAIEFMQDNRDGPFFLYLPHTMPHIPLFVTDDFLGKSEGGLYGDTIEEIDHHTGRIMDALKELDLDEKTLVIYTTDNGPWNLQNGHGGSADPLRGFKFSTFEGGMRVPCVMRWPGRIPAGEVCDEVAGTIDLLPTLATLAGCELPADRVIDGKNIGTLMREPQSATSPHDAYYYYRGNNLQAMRQGDWKVRRANDQVQLFHLAEDMAESNNLAESDPDRTARMLEAMQAFDNRLKQEARNR